MHGSRRDGNRATNRVQHQPRWNALDFRDRLLRNFARLDLRLTLLFHLSLKHRGSGRSRLDRRRRWWRRCDIDLFERRQLGNLGEAAASSPARPSFRHHRINRDLWSIGSECLDFRSRRSRRQISGLALGSVDRRVGSGRTELIRSVEIRCSRGSAPASSAKRSNAPRPSWRNSGPRPGWTGKRPGWASC